MSPRQAPEAELQSLRSEHARLTEIVNEFGKQLEEIDRKRHEISQTFTTAWSKRDQVERRLFVLEMRVKHLKPAAMQPKREKTVEALLANLSPVMKSALKAALLRQQVEKGR